MVLAWHDAALAWNDAGHRAVALAAYDALGNDAQRRAVALLHSHPRFDEDFAPHLPAPLRNAAVGERDRWYFAFAATWPDFAREFAGVRPDSARLALVTRYHHPSWHYINLPTYLRDADRQLQIAEPPLLESADLPDDGLNLVQALVRTSHLLCQPATAPAQEGLALSWLLHLMADLHQPLHATSLYWAARFPRGDRGGNDIALANFRGSSNLHAFWDAAAGTAAGLRTSPVPAHVETFADLARQSRELAATEAYAPGLRAQLTHLAADAPVRVVIDADYEARAAATARAQLALAAQRTATLLAALLASHGDCPLAF